MRTLPGFLPELIRVFLKTFLHLRTDPVPLREMSVEGGFWLKGRPTRCLEELVRVSAIVQPYLNIHFEAAVQ